MYYPKSQITTNLYTNGEEFQNAVTGEPHVGFYYITSNGDAFSNKSPNDKPTFRLVPRSTPNTRPNLYIEQASNINEYLENDNRNSYYEIEKGGIYSVVPDEPTAPSPPLFLQPQPTVEDYENGEFIRYFGYKNCTNETVETNQSQFNLLQSQAPNIQYDLYTPISISWTITGNKESASKTNFNSVKLKENRENLPGFSQYFKGKYDKYFKYQDNENLYSDGTELRYTKSKKRYIGFYHIHPEKGPMVGAQHVLTPHEFLEFIPSGSALNPLPPTIQSGSYAEPVRNISITSGGY